MKMEELLAWRGFSGLSRDIILLVKCVLTFELLIEPLVG